MHMAFSISGSSPVCLKPEIPPHPSTHPINSIGIFVAASEILLSFVSRLLCLDGPFREGEIWTLPCQIPVSALELPLSRGGSVLIPVAQR